MSEIGDDKHLISCKNCETEFHGKFCPNCGQSIKDYDRPFSFIVYDLMGNIITFDTRLWITLKTILFKPGKIAEEFILGRRVRYMPPFRFYVFVSFIFFLLLNFSSSKNIEHDKNHWFQVSADSDSVDVDDSLSRAEDSIVVYPTYVYNADSNKSVPVNDTIFLDSASNDGNILNTDVNDVKDHPEIYAQVFLKYLSWSLFLAMPAFAFFLWLFFRKKHKHYIGHLIFAVNQHAFLFLILSILLALNLLFPNTELSYVGLIVFLVPVYSVIGAKRLYLRSWVSTFFRLVSIFFIYMFLLFSLIIGVLLLTFV